MNESNFYNLVEENNSLKIGTIVNINYASTKNPQSSPFPTYRVCVKEKMNGTLVDTFYDNCALADIFGSGPDFLDYSFRINNNNLFNDGTSTPGPDDLLGSVVLLQCVNGLTSQGVIVGAIRNYRSVTKPGYQIITPDDYPYLNFSFNGVDFGINKLGEMVITRKGPNNSAGTYLTKVGDSSIDSTAANSFVKIDVAGNITLNAGQNETSTSTNNTPSLQLMKDGNIFISSGQQNDSQTTANNYINIMPNGDIKIQINKGSGLTLTNKDSDSTMIVGDGSVHAAIAEEVNKLYNQVKQYLDSHTHPSSLGPTGAPLLPSPDYNTAIQSNKLKFPSG